MKEGIKSFLKITCSGIAGVVLTLLYQHFFAQPQSFAFIYNGNEIIVTESEYLELVEQNNQLKKDLFSLQEKIDQLNSTEDIQQILQLATEYWEKAEYIQSLSILKNSKAKSEDVKYLYQNYSDEYCIIILNQVDNLILERNYDEAKSVLMKAKEIVDNSKILDAKLVDVNNNMPAKLSNLKLSASRFFDIIQNRTIEDSVGNRYSSGNLFLAKAEGKTSYGYATFYLGEKYTELSAIIAVSDESENRSDTQLEGWIEIYSKSDNEDYNLLYSSPILSRATAPITVSNIKLDYSTWLEIRYYNNGEYWSLAGGYHSLEIIIADAIVYSN